MELIMAICLPYLIQKPVFTMPIKPPVVQEQAIQNEPVKQNVIYLEPVQPFVKAPDVGPNGELPTPYYLPQEVPQTEYAPRPDRPGYDL